jgi:conjugal transfer ATP-binding protein TraC
MEKALAAVKGLRKYSFREEIFPNEFIEDSLIIRPDGNISVGFTVAFPSSEEIDEAEILAIEASLEKVFSRLPEGTVVHFQTQYFNSPDSIKAYEETLSGFLVGTMINHFRDRAVMKSKTVLYICFNLHKTKQRSPLNTLFANYATWKNPLTNLVKDKALIKGYVQTFTTLFANVPKIRIQQLNDIGLGNELIRYNNLDFSATNPKQVQYDNDHANLHNKYLVGDKYAGFCYLGKSANPLFRSSRNDRGVNTFMGWPLGFSLDFPHVVNLSFRIEGEGLLKWLDIIKNLRKSMGKNTREIDVLANEDLTQFTQEMRGEGKVPVTMSHNVMTWATHPDELSYRLDLIKAGYLQMNGSTGMVPAMNTGNFFHANKPGYALEMFHTLVMSLEDAILHFDYSKETISDQKGTLLCTRTHEPVLVDFWTSALANKNKLCIGPSGSGKSFTWNAIISQAIEAGDEITLLDVGGSYKNLFTLYEDSKYIETNTEDGLRFNPFLLQKNDRGEYVLTEDKMNFLLALISLLWKRVDKGETLSKEEESIFSEWITLFYKEINTNRDTIPRFEKFVAFVEDIAQSPAYAATARFIDMGSFTLVMKKFITNGGYAKVLDSEDNINISDRKLICFDLFGVQKDPILYPVVAMIIVELVLDKIRRNPTKRKQIVIDEAWSMLSGSMGDFIETVFRTCRKYNASITIISQGIIELKQSKVGEAIKANAATRIILDHNSQPALIADVKNFFSLTDHEEELLSSIRNGGTWREVFIQRGNVSQVFVVDVGPHAKAAFSSEAKDRAKINELSKKVNPEYAIKQVVENSLNDE